MVEMMLESQEVMIGSKELNQIIKGKRTKRQRPASPPIALPITSSSSAVGGDGGEEREGIFNNGSSPSNSVEFAESVREEEDMANCLILLAQGNYQNRKVTEPGVVIAPKAGGGLDVYECKTCNRCFPSFQALGGHRASHKRPNKPSKNDEKKPVAAVIREEEHQLHNMNTTLSLQLASRGFCSGSNVKSNKVHECSICGAEFSSGQALGGHMRRHRTSVGIFTATTTEVAMSLESNNHDHQSQESKKPRNSLELDLNLPAPEDDHARDSKFHLASKEQVLVFSASPLVDCHY